MELSSPPSPRSEERLQEVKNRICLGLQRSRRSSGQSGKLGSRAARQSGKRGNRAIGQKGESGNRATQAIGQSGKSGIRASRADWRIGQSGESSLTVWTMHEPKSLDCQIADFARLARLITLPDWPDCSFCQTGAGPTCQTAERQIGARLLFPSRASRAVGRQSGTTAIGSQLI